MDGVAGWLPYSACPCGCDVVAHKLTRVGHSLGCKCRPCLGRRNRAKGPASARRRHRALGGSGFTPHDEMGNVYSVEVVVQDKFGAQVGAKFPAFAMSEFVRHAISQAERVTPEGVQAYPALYLEPGGGAGTWLLVQLVKPSRRG